MIIKSVIFQLPRDRRIEKLTSRLSTGRVRRRLWAHFFTPSFQKKLEYPMVLSRFSEVWETLESSLQSTCVSGKFRVGDALFALECIKYIC